jgi:hypothetical protein
LGLSHYSAPGQAEERISQRSDAGESGRLAPYALTFRGSRSLRARLIQKQHFSGEFLPSISRITTRIRPLVMANPAEKWSRTGRQSAAFDSSCRRKLPRRQKVEGKKWRMPVTGFLHAGSLGLRSNLVAAFRRAARDVETALSCLLFPKADIQLSPANVCFWG